MKWCYLRIEVKDFCVLSNLLMMERISPVETHPDSPLFIKQCLHKKRFFLYCRIGKGIGSHKMFSSNPWVQTWFMQKLLHFFTDSSASVPHHNVKFTVQTVCPVKHTQEEAQGRHDATFLHIEHDDGFLAWRIYCVLLSVLSKYLILVKIAVV